MDKRILAGTGITVLVTTIVSGGIYLYRNRESKEVRKFKGCIKDIKKEHWMSNKSKDARKEVLKWVQGKVKGTEELKEELQTIETKHYMSNEYKAAMMKILDWVQAQRKEGK